MQSQKDVIDSTSTPVAKEDLEKARKRELKKIRQKFGLKLHDSANETVVLKPGYQDRAEVRRQTVGIDPVGAKTEQASTLVPIAKKNKGFQMLAKMGWNEGQALGKNETADAITEPVYYNAYLTTYIATHLDSDGKKITVDQQFKNYFADVKSGDKKASEVAALVADSTLPPAVKHHLVSQIPLDAPVKESIFQKIWATLKGE